MNIQVTLFVTSRQQDTIAQELSYSLKEKKDAVRDFARSLFFAKLSELEAAERLRELDEE